MSLTAHPALVLNADFRPMTTSRSRCVVAGRHPRRGSASASPSWPSTTLAARGPSTRIRLPSVVALRKYQPLARRVAFTRFNVFLRDRFRCQYCGETIRVLGVDVRARHPALARRHHDWSNIVTACVPCNARQGQLAARRAAPPAPRSQLESCSPRSGAFPPSYLHQAGRLPLLGRAVEAQRYHPRPCASGVRLAVSIVQGAADWDGEAVGVMVVE